MSGPNYGPTRDNTASVVSFYRLVLKGKYLDRFNEQADSLNYYDAMTLGGKLFEMQKYDPGDDCDCAGPNDRPGCPVCAQAAANTYPIVEKRVHKCACGVAYRYPNLRKQEKHERTQAAREVYTEEF